MYLVLSANPVLQSLCCCLAAESHLTLKAHGIGCQAPVHAIFRRGDWNVLPLPSPGHLPHPRVEPKFPALAGGFFTTEPLGSPSVTIHAWNSILTTILWGGFSETQNRFHKLSLYFSTYFPNPEGSTHKFYVCLFKFFSTWKKFICMHVFISKPTCKIYIAGFNFFRTDKLYDVLFTICLFFFSVIYWY